MKQIFTAIAIIAMMVSFNSCEKKIICECNCSCNNSNGGSDNNTDRPGNNDQNNDPDNDPNNGGNEDNSDYEIYNTTFTYGNAGYYGVYYDGQPDNTSNWYIALADDNYDIDNWEGDGYNIILEIFAQGTDSSSLPAGTYTIEAFEKNEYSAGSLLYGFIAEDEENGEFPAGTWLFKGDEGIAGATSGEVKISVSGGQYTITYNLYDNEYMVNFKGSYKGPLTIYDGTEEVSSTQAAASKRVRR